MEVARTVGGTTRGQVCAHCAAPEVSRPSVQIGGSCVLLRSQTVRVL